MEYVFLSSCQSPILCCTTTTTTTAAATAAAAALALCGLSPCSSSTAAALVLELVAGSAVSHRLEAIEAGALGGEARTDRGVVNAVTVLEVKWRRLLR